VEKIAELFVSGIQENNNLNPELIFHYYVLHSDWHPKALPLTKIQIAKTILTHRFVGHICSVTRTRTRRCRERAIGWVVLKDMNEACSVQTSEYAVRSRLAEEPAFAWWVPHTLKKRNRIIAKIKSNY
jgi:hypothetical protein